MCFKCKETSEQKFTLSKKLKIQRDIRLRKTYPVKGLPGWTREEVTRSKGASAGSVDVYYHPPSGPSCRSKKDMQKVLGNSVDLSKLVYKTGVFTNFKK